MNLGIRNGKDFQDHRIAVVGRDLWMSLVKPLCSKQGQEQHSHGLESVSFPCKCIINNPVLWASPVQVTFVDVYNPPLSVKITPGSGWLKSTALSSLLAEGMADTRLPPEPPLFFFAEGQQGYSFLFVILSRDISACVTNSLTGALYTSEFHFFDWLASIPICWFSGQDVWLICFLRPLPKNMVVNMSSLSWRGLCTELTQINKTSVLLANF